MEDTEVMAVDADRLAELCENDSAVGYNLMLKIDQIYFERYRYGWQTGIGAHVHPPSSNHTT